MNIAYRMQKIQDWFTQQWIILWGRKINPLEYTWLMGPFGEVNGIGEEFIYQLAKKEHLTIIRNSKSKGLLNDISELDLPQIEVNKLSEKIIDFYTNTAKYNLKFHVKWHPFFKTFGYLVNRLFSQRINQLNIPTENIKYSENLTSEIIELVSTENGATIYTIWLRKLESTGRVIYSGIYSTCRLPSGSTCIKAVFPLPKGNATVILKPSVGKKSELILNSFGNSFGDAGFYFLLNDSKGYYWSQYIKSFSDKLIVSDEHDNLKAIQTLKLWHITVATFEYTIVH